MFQVKLHSRQGSTEEDGVYLDGKKLGGVQRVEINTALNQLPEVTITFLNRDFAAELSGVGASEEPAPPKGPLASGAFRNIRLETSGGEFVTTGVIPPFQALPAVVVWGSRVFRAFTRPGASVDRFGAVETDDCLLCDRDDLPIYREVFYVAVVQTKDG